MQGNTHLPGPFDRIAKLLLEELGTAEAISQLPYEILYKAMVNADNTHFITHARPMLKLEGIVGPYTVYDDQMGFLYRMNLHNGYFGAVWAELDFIPRLLDGTILTLQYITQDNEMRSLQIIKVGPPMPAPLAQ